MQVEEAILFGDDGGYGIWKHVYNKERSIPEAANRGRFATKAAAGLRVRGNFEQIIEGGTGLRHFSNGQAGVKNKPIQIHQRFFIKR